MIRLFSNLDNWLNSASVLVQDTHGNPLLDAEQFSAYVGNLRLLLRQRDDEKWYLHTSDTILFLVAFTALLYEEKEIHLVSAQELQAVSDSDSIGIISDVSDLNGISKADFSSKVSYLEFRPLFSDLMNIYFHTSGSTGKPKEVGKSLRALEAEITNLTRLWGDDLQNCVFYSTVSSMHVYGFLYNIGLPIALGCLLTDSALQFPESLELLAGRKTALVTSPAFLKRLEASSENDGLDFSDRAPVKVFSSGGVLPVRTAESAVKKIGINSIDEIYGSTETGGIGYKQNPGESVWHPFNGIELVFNDDETTRLFSPYLDDSAGFLLSDRISQNQDGTFHLQGRMDSVVKIEEKRVALNDVENRIQETGFVRDTIVLAFSEKRQYLAAVVELNTKGRQHFDGFERKDISRFFREHLRAYFVPIVVPRKWRFVDTIPRNAQGKIRMEDAKALFN